MLSAAPADFELVFSEPVTPLRMTLVGPDGASRDLPGPSATSATLTVPAPAGLVAGSHLLLWRVVSADGHPVGGTIRFALGAPSAVPPAAPADEPASVLVLVWASRLLVLAGLVFGIGGAVAGLLLGPRSAPARGPVRLALALGLAAVPLALLAQGLDALGAPLAAVAQPAVWHAGAATSLGSALALASAAMALALAATLRQRPANGTRLPKALSFAALLVAGFAVAASGHAANAAPQALMRPAVFIHALAMMLWIGALAPLAASLRGGASGGAAALRRFSRVIPAVVAALVASGAALAAVQLGSPGALWSTAYGRVLLAKLALLALLFALAAGNRHRLTPRVLTGETGATRTLRRVVGAEIALAVLVLGTAALWRFTPPPRVAAAIAAEPVTAHATGASLMADLALQPGRAGRASVSAMLMTIDYGPVAPADVAFTLAAPSGTTPPLRVAAVNGGDGFWRAEVTLPEGGIWRVAVEVGLGAGAPERLETVLKVRP
ncbi:copper transport protein [Aureimonas pseudogalii]|uniref:Copper transport protein n=2 Tax=Aureimonas pseudogalii TaxID=1744844 RepID=A0A7W6H6I6_9HYPH|nr:copper transport protein [Aureimonas pseudogalii]